MYGRILVVLFLAVASALAAPSRVIDGREAEKGEFPYQISLQYGYSLVHRHVCGGSILNSRWILTAGHCITEVPHFPLAHYYVKAGITELSEKGETVRVKKIIVHPEYQGGVNPNDIALLELDKDLQFNDEVQPIRLPQADSKSTGISTLSGWGSTSNTSSPSYPAHLQCINLTIISYEECKELLIKSLGEYKPLAETNICTGVVRRSDSGACSGDSGGPLVVKAGNTTTQVGIVSWGLIPCGQEGAPSVYTRVSAFLDFIKKHVKDPNNM